MSKDVTLFYSSMYFYHPFRKNRIRILPTDCKAKKIYHHTRNKHYPLAPFLFANYPLHPVPHFPTALQSIIFGQSIKMNDKLGFILAFPLRGRGTAEAVDEGNEICIALTAF